MRNPGRIAVLLAALLLLAPAAWAQHPGRGKARGHQKHQKKGPAFCRSGAGHPVWGREWCLDKGFGLGSRGWIEVGLEDIFFQRRPRHYPGHARLEWGELQVVLGGVHVLTRVVREIPGLAPYDRSVVGRWRDRRGEPVHVLELLVAGRPVAELHDRDLDGSVEVLLVRER